MQGSCRKEQSAIKAKVNDQLHKGTRSRKSSYNPIALRENSNNNRKYRVEFSSIYKIILPPTTTYYIATCLTIYLYLSIHPPSLPPPAFSGLFNMLPQLDGYFGNSRSVDFYSLELREKCYNPMNEIQC